MKVTLSIQTKNPAKNRRETGIFAEGDVEIKDTGTGGKVIVLLNRRHISSLFA